MMANINTESTTIITDLNLQETTYDKIYNRFEEDDIVQSIETKTIYDQTTAAGTVAVDADLGSDSARQVFTDNSSSDVIATIATLSGDSTNTTEYAEYLRYRSILFNGGDLYSLAEPIAGSKDGSTFLDRYNNADTPTGTTKWYVIDLKRSLLYDGIDVDEDITLAGITLDVSENLTEYPIDDTYKNLNIGKIYRDENSDGVSNDYYIIPKLGLIITSRDITGMTALDLSVYENITSLVYFCRLKNKKFNFTNNPTWVDDDSAIIEEYQGNPTTFVTTIGLYNDSNELLAIAKLNKPVKKSFSEELLLRTLIKY
jgi:hypothetical protein